MTWNKATTIIRLADTETVKIFAQKAQVNEDEIHDFESESTHRGYIVNNIIDY